MSDKISEADLQNYNERVYAWDARNGVVVYRIPGHRHGGGSEDSDENPVWLSIASASAIDNGVDIENLPDIFIE